METLFPLDFMPVLSFAWPVSRIKSLTMLSVNGTFRGAYHNAILKVMATMRPLRIANLLPQLRVMPVTGRANRLRASQSQSPGL